MFQLNKKNNNNNEYKSKSNYNNKTNLIITEPKINIENIILKSKVAELSVNSLLDTGSSLNLIPEKVLKKIYLKPEKDKEITLKFDNGSVMNINSYVEIHIQFDKIKNVKFNVKLYCLPSLPYDIVLGSGFFIKNNVIIDYSQLFVKIEIGRLKYVLNIKVI
ncbi:hypothetical protein DMUE_3990 [Dictyocoela muelleri]|nr:hypothetical protein DMUE_3990 [Dictyocoela muelleri]